MNASQSLLLRILPSLLLASGLANWTTTGQGQEVADATNGISATIWLEPTRAAGGRLGLSPRDIVRTVATVEKFNDQAITLRKSNETTSSTFAEYRVIWIAPYPLPDPVSTAVSAVHDRKTSVDIAALLAELKKPQPAWVSQWVGMHLWQATYLGEKHAATLELINQLDTQPMPSVMLGGLPIHWQKHEISPIAVSAAQSQLASKREATLLTAASWLLNSSVDSDARRVLGQLAKDSKRPSIRILASILLGIELQGDRQRQLSAETVKAFDELPLTLSIGPTERLSAWYQQHGQQEHAIELLLRGVLIAPRPAPLSHFPPESDDFWKTLNSATDR